MRSQMRKGVLEYCILSILDKKEAYASSILDELKAANMIVSDLRRVSEKADREGWIEDDEIQKIMKK